MRLAARAALSALAVGVACGALAAPGEDPLAWLTRAAQAARTTTFAGTFAHTNGDRTSTVRITHAVENLPAEQREVFLMREIGHVPFKDIAEITGVPENTVKSRMRYALERLQEALAEYEDYARALR